MTKKYKRLFRLAYHSCKALAIVSALFSLSVCALLISNYLRFRSAEAYISNLSLIRLGIFLLAGGAAVLLISSTFMFILHRQVTERVKTDVGKMSATPAGLSGNILIVGAGIGLVAIALVFAFLSYAAIERNHGSIEAGIASLKSIQEAARERARIEAESVVYKNYLAAEELKVNWPSFRGPGGVGVALNADPPTTWNGTTGAGILWKVELPKPGNNSPIVWANRLFLSGADEEVQEVYCFDRYTGKVLWSRVAADIPGSPAEPPDVSQDTGHAPSTMATDGSHVFAIFPTGDVICFDFDGNQMWARNLGVPENHYGHASSLITYRDRLVVQYDQEEKAKLMALRADTGETVWETKRHVLTSWASPIVVYTGKRPEIILNANPIVASYNAETGREIWYVECMMGEVGPSPAYDNGIVYAVNQFWMLAAVDVTTREIIWEAYDDLPEAGSPVASAGLVFLPTTYGVFSCLDGKTGEVYWVHEFKEGSYASPIRAGDKIYWTDRSGITHIFKAEKELTLIGEPELGEQCHDHGSFRWRAYLYSWAETPVLYRQS